MKHTIVAALLLGALCTLNQNSTKAQNPSPSGVTASGSLTITVTNAEDWGNAGQFGRVELYDETNHLVSTAFTVQSKVTFTNLIAGNLFSYKVWYDRLPSKPSGEEFWGGKGGITILPDQTVEESFVRNHPYVPEIALFDAITNAPVAGQIVAGHSLRVVVTVRNPANPGAVSGTSRSRLVLDRDFDKPFDFADSSQYQSLAAGNDRFDQYTVTLTMPGTYRYYCGVVEDEAGSSITCDGSDWSNILVVADKFEYAPDVSTSALYHLSELNGNWVMDASGRDLAGAITGTSIVPGRFGLGRNFTGAPDYISVADDSALNFSAGKTFTVECWARISGVLISEGAILTKWGTIDAAAEWSLTERSTGLEFTVNSSTGAGSPNSSVTTMAGQVPTNSWFHVACVWNGNTGFQGLYVNGVLMAVTTAAVSTMPHTSIPLRIGYNGAGGAFSGTIDEVRVSRTIRQPLEFNLQLPPKNPVASASTGAINVNWQNGGGAVGMLRYRVYRGVDSTSLNLIDSTRSLLYTDGGATPGLRIYYRIATVDSSGFESLKSVACSAIAPPSVPSILAVEPGMAKPGVDVVVTGSGFGASAQDNIVVIGGVRATVKSGSVTRIVATVPLGAGFGPVTVTARNLTAYSKKPFVPTFDGDGTLTTASFSARVEYGANNGCVFGVVCDIDGDGKPDIVEPVVTNSTVLILRNTSTPGSFAPSSFAASSFPVGGTPYRVAAGDFDGDGRLDLVTSNNGGGSATVLKNTGSQGSLSFTRTDYYVASSPSGVSVSDLDKDGKPDIFLLAATTGVLRNTSTQSGISFASPLMLPTGGAQCAIADIDGDGLDDLVAAQRAGQGYMTVHRNTSVPGQLSFQGGTSFEAGPFVHGITTGDLDGDGKVDVVITVGAGGGSVRQISVFRNISTPGNVAFATRADYPTATDPVWNVTLADVDGDGKLDVGIPLGLTSYAALYRNTSIAGAISFAPRVDIPTGAGPYDLLFGDFDLDGKPDIATATFYGITGVSVHRNLVGTSIVTVPPWSFTNTGITHTIIISTTSNPNINGTPLVAGDYVGVFCDSGGTIACAGYERWTGTGNIAVTAFGDDPTSTPKDGFATGELFRWKIFRAANGVVYDATAAYAPAGGVITNTNTFATNGISQLSSLVGGSVTHTLTLRIGWGMISSYVEPFTPLLDSVFKPILADVIIVKNGAGKSFIPSALVNTIGSWSKTEGYQVKMNASLSLPVRGLRLLPADNPVNLPAGWSIMSYLRDADLAIATALSPIAADIIIVKDQDGKTYIPSVGINSIGNLKVGQGYQIKLSSERTLTYPNRGEETPQIVATEKRTSVSTTAPSWYFANTGSSHTIVIPQSAVLKVDGVALTAGDYIGIFYDSTGTLACAGYEAWTGTGGIAIPAFGDDPTTTTKDGFTAGESFTWKVWRHGDGMVCRMTPVYVATGGMGGIVSDTGGYNTNGISGLVSLSGTTTGVAKEEMPTNYALQQNYPNPFNPATVIPFALPLRSQVSLVVYNALGQVVANVINGELEAGYHNVMFDAHDLPSGVYFYRLRAGTFVATRKLAVVR